MSHAIILPLSHFVKVDALKLFQSLTQLGVSRFGLLYHWLFSQGKTVTPYKFGKINDDEFYQRTCDILGLDRQQASKEQFFAAWNSMCAIDQAGVDKLDRLAKSLPPGVDLVLTGFSNPAHIEVIRAQYQQLHPKGKALPGKLLLSYEQGTGDLIPQVRPFLGKHLQSAQLLLTQPKRPHSWWHPIAWWAYFNASKQVAKYQRQAQEHALTVSMMDNLSLEEDGSQNLYTLIAKLEHTYRQGLNEDFSTLRDFKNPPLTEVDALVVLAGRHGYDGTHLNCRVQSENYQPFPLRTTMTTELNALLEEHQDTDYPWDSRDRLNKALKMAAAHHQEYGHYPKLVFIEGQQGADILNGLLSGERPLPQGIHPLFESYPKELFVIQVLSPENLHTKGQIDLLKQGDLLGHISGNEMIKGQIGIITSGYHIPRTRRLAADLKEHYKVSLFACDRKGLKPGTPLDIAGECARLHLYHQQGKLPNPLATQPFSGEKRKFKIV